MKAVKRIADVVDVLLELFTVFLMVLLTVTVIVAVLARLSGNSFSWYDEVAAIMLAWITYYGSALAALRRRHIGFDTVLLALPVGPRMIALVAGEVVILAFFVLLAWAGFRVLAVLHGSYLVSLTWVPVQFTQSVIPIGAVLFIFCQLLSLPGYWRTTQAGYSLEHAEIEEEVDAEREKNRDRGEGLR